MFKSIKNSFAKAEFSKKITVCFILFYILNYILMEFILVKYKIDVSSTFDYVHSVMMTIVYFYFGKSGVENVVKVITGNSNIFNATVKKVLGEGESGNNESAS